MTTRGPRLLRFARRLYVLALVSVGAAVLTFFLVRNIVDRPPEPRFLIYMVHHLVDVVDDPVARDKELQRMLDEAQLQVAVYDPAGALVATSVQPAPPLPIRAAGSEHKLRPAGKGWFVFPATAVTGQTYTVMVHMPPPPHRNQTVMVGAVLVVLILVSVVFAAMLVGPLDELARVTDALGKGRLSARADPKRAGVFDELAARFNDMADRLQTSIRAEQQLLAGVSHELRTPLARIRVALDLAAEGQLDLRGDELARVGADLDELDVLVADILTAARLHAQEGGMMSSFPLRVEPVALAELLESSAARFARLHPAHPLAASFAPALPVLDGDASMLRRVLDNLLDNAAHHTPPGTAVTVSADVEADTVRVVVSDRGPGVSDDDLPLLFSPFFRADRSRTRQTEGGVGLGLALARRIVEAHGGTLQAQPTPPQGLSFTMTLPLTSHRSSDA